MVVKADEKASYVARAKMFKALSDPRRIQIIDILMSEEALSGTELAERLDISLALLSHHWKILAEAGLIQCTQQGQIKFGTLQRKQITALMSTCICPDQLSAATNEDEPKKKPRPPKRSAR